MSSEGGRSNDGTEVRSHQLESSLYRGEALLRLRALAPDMTTISQSELGRAEGLLLPARNKSKETNQMALHKGLMREGFKLPTCEKHFHDYDETWLILSGRGTGYWIDQDGVREDFNLESGDVWMIPAGFEHGSEGFLETKINSEDFRIQVFNGTLAPGHHALGHHYIEHSRYIPRLTLTKTPTDRYQQKDRPNRGVTLIEKGKAKFGPVEFPRLRPGEILCRTLVSGLTNGTERNALLGGTTTAPFRDELVISALPKSSKTAAE